MTPQKNTTPEKDPIVEGSLLWPIFIAIIVLVVSGAWALYDEFYTRRPYKNYQNDWVEVAKDAYQGKMTDAQEAYAKVVASPKYRELRTAYEAAAEAAGAPYQALQEELNKGVLPRLAVIGIPVKELRSEVNAAVYRIERAREHPHDPVEERKWMKEVNRLKSKVVPFEFAGGEKVEWQYKEMTAEFDRLKKLQGTIQGRMATVKSLESAARKAMNEYLSSNLAGPSPTSISTLLTAVDEFEHEIKQIHIKYDDGELIERCESCHLGIRSPVPLSLDEVGGRKEFVSHPNPEMLKIHDPEVMGCSPCHGGNGIAVSSVEKAHGQYKHWLWPMHAPENVEAGCFQCHTEDRFLEHSETYNESKHLYSWRGCVGCHRHQQFAKEEDEEKAIATQLTNSQDLIKSTMIEIARLNEVASTAEDDDVIEAAFAGRRSKRQELALLRTADVSLQERMASLQMEKKMVGPNLKEITAKLNPGWLQSWLMYPRAFRPDTKMPKFRIDDEQAWNIAAFLWQSGDPVAYDKQPAEGDSERGEWLITTRGCMGCHNVSTEEFEGGIGSGFASNLSRVGEKANYGYLVSWLKQPRLHNPYTVMPSLRLSDQDARDIASFLITKKSEDAEYLADSEALPILTDKARYQAGEKLVKHLGCAGCHQIKGLENEDRIGVELTKEGSKPIERLDFGLLTHEFKRSGKYKHKYFFENKLKNPAIWDKDKVKDSYFDRLKMPNFWPDLTPKAELMAAKSKLEPESDNYDTELAAVNRQLKYYDDVDALTTFLLGSVEANVPESIIYNPTGIARDIQEGWWIIKKYNCDGCHQIRPGEMPDIWKLPIYEAGAGFDGVPDANGRPPTLVGQGSRTDPSWLSKFLDNPALTTDPDKMHRNGVRMGLAVRMPTFHLSERERGKLVRFFNGLSKLGPNYVRPEIEPLTGDMLDLGRAAFVAGDCANCHLLGGETDINPSTTYAPSFVPVAERIKPSWIHPWVTKPDEIIVGTAMPALLTPIEEGDRVRWVFDASKINATAKRRLGEDMLKKLSEYKGDHGTLLMRYFAHWTDAEGKWQAEMRKK